MFYRGGDRFRGKEKIVRNSEINNNFRYLEGSNPSLRPKDFRGGNIASVTHWELEIWREWHTVGTQGGADMYIEVFVFAGSRCKWRLTSTPETNVWISRCSR